MSSSRKSASLHRYVWLNTSGSTYALVLIVTACVIVYRKKAQVPSDPDVDRPAYVRAACAGFMQACFGVSWISLGPTASCVLPFYILSHVRSIPFAREERPAEEDADLSFGSQSTRQKDSRSALARWNTACSYGVSTLVPGTCVAQLERGCFCAIPCRLCLGNHVARLPVLRSRRFSLGWNWRQNAGVSRSILIFPHIC